MSTGNLGGHNMGNNCFVLFVQKLFGTIFVFKKTKNLYFLFDFQFDLVLLLHKHRNDPTVVGQHSVDRLLEYFEILSLHQW